MPRPLDANLLQFPLVSLQSVLDLLAAHNAPPDLSLQQFSKLRPHCAQTMRHSSSLFFVAIILGMISESGGMGMD